MKEKKIDLRHMDGGQYVLTEDVTNPKPNRRASRDWTNAPVWNKGMRLFVRERDERDIMDDGRTFKTFAIEGIDERWSHMNIHRGQNNAEKWNAITAKMERVPEDLDGMLHRLDAGGWTRARILGQLVDSSKVTLADIEKAYNEAMRDGDDIGTIAAGEDAL